MFNKPVMGFPPTVFNVGPLVPSQISEIIITVKAVVSGELEPGGHPVP